VTTEETGHAPSLLPRLPKASMPCSLRSPRIRPAGKARLVKRSFFPSKPVLKTEGLCHFCTSNAASVATKSRYLVILDIILILEIVSRSLFPNEVRAFLDRSTDGAMLEWHSVCNKEGIRRPGGQL